MIPLSDENPTRGLPVLTIGVIVACVLVFLWQTGGNLPFEQSVGEYGFIPARLLATLSAEAMDYPFPTSPQATLITSMFLHGSWMHLGGNMLYLWIFGDNIEAAMGKVRYLLFYLVGGLAAALTQGALNPASTVPMVGASGAISAVLGAYLVLYPHARVRVLVPNHGVTSLPALTVLGSWFLYQFLYGMLAVGQEGGGVAFWAHVGGFVAGVVLVKPFLLGRAKESPRLWD